MPASGISAFMKSSLTCSAWSSGVPTRREPSASSTTTCTAAFFAASCRHAVAAAANEALRASIIKILRFIANSFGSSSLICLLFHTLLLLLNADMARTLLRQSFMRAGTPPQNQHLGTQDALAPPAVRAGAPPEPHCH